METTNSKGSLYWLAKGFIIFFILFSAYYSYTHVEDLRKLGFPDYFRNELVIAKVLGAIVLIVPFSTLRMREWVYAGFIITMVSAITAHICSGDPLAKIIFCMFGSLPGVYQYEIRFSQGNRTGKLLKTDYT
jgi:putative oxidoreductase